MRQKVTNKKPKRMLVMSWDEVPVVVDLPYIAYILGVSKEQVRKYCLSGVLPAFKLDKTWRINKQDLMKFCGVNEKQKGGEE